MNKQPHPAVSVTSLASASSTSSGASATSADGQSSSMATSTSVQKMDSELRCPACRRYFYCPLLLPCGHSLCTSCAAVALIPSSDPQVNAIVQASTNHPSEQYTTSVGTSCSSASSTTGSSIGSSSQTAGNNVSSQSTGCATTIHQSGSSNPDSDQVSVLSETDSGVVVTSRPGSCINRLPVLVGHPYSSTSSTSGLSLVTHGLVCPTCNQIVGLFDDRGIGHLPRNRALERIVNKFVSPELLQQNLIHSTTLDRGTFPILLASDPLSRPGGPLCQLCEEPEPSLNQVTVGVAAVWCEQCEIFYCSSCKEKCHPSRGPLLRHILHSAAKGVEIIQQKRQNQSTPCPAHPHMLINLYCVNCHTPICHECLGTEGSFTQDQHGKHEVQSLHAVCKAKKTELSQALQSLSEKARSGTEYIQRLRSKSETIKLQILESERHVEAQLNALITALENKKCELTERLRQLRESRVLGMKEQIGQVTTLLTRSTGLIQFCIEMLKETDPSAFLVVSQSLIMRAQKAEQLFAHEHDQAVSVAENTESLLKGLRPCTSHRGYLLEQSECDSNSHVNAYNGMHEYEFGLKMTVVETIQQAIDELCLHEDRNIKSHDIQPQQDTAKKFEVPTAPIFLPDECITERNVITLVWQPTSTITVDRYTLELDDGANGNFRKVYRGPETICTVEGLHFRSVYRARVKAHNSAGESSYSDKLCLQTADLTWFHLESNTAPPEILLTNGSRTVTSQVAEDRVVLGSTGLSRGMHYWEFTVDRCDIGGQPAFGIARQDTNRETMLGSDMRSWSVYFDYKRSWFLHNGEHFERTDGGVRAGSVVGVRLDCDRGSLSYYLNDEPHGPIAFTNLPPGIYYPAVSLSRAVQLTLHTGLEAPSESEESDEDSSGAGTGTETTSMATTVLGHAGTHSFTTPFTLTKQ